MSAKETAKEAKSSEEAAKRAADIANRVEKAAELIQGKVDESLDNVYPLTEMQSELEVENVTAELEAISLQTDVSDVVEQVTEQPEETREEEEYGDDFVQGITAAAPKIVFEGEDEENPQFYVIEPQDSQNSNEKILSLHKAGMSNVAIAKELGLGVGEVKLVIDLFEGTSR